MTILLPVLAVAFAAICVWLVIRIVNRRERWAKWTAVGLVVVLVGYPLSSGPMLWLAYRDYVPPWVHEKFTWPLEACLEILMQSIPVSLVTPLYDAVYWYNQLWIPADQ